MDDDGESLDPRGRRIDPSRFIWRDGAPVHDEARDAEYTRELGERLVDAYARDNVVQSTQLTAHAALLLLRHKNNTIDLMRLLRAGGKVDDLPLLELYAEVERELSELRGLMQPGGVRLAPILESGSAVDVVADGLRHFSIYHTRAALTRKGDRVFPTDRSLLFYYSNRLEGYRLGRALCVKPALNAEHRGLFRGA